MTWVYVLGGWILLAVVVAIGLSLVLRGRARFNPAPAVGRRARARGSRGDRAREPQDDVRLVALVAEDHEPLRRVLATLLETDERFRQALFAANGAEALACARETRLDVVLLDVDMPVMSGLEALPHLRALQHAPAVLLFTAEESVDVLRATDHQQVRLLAKTTPIDVVIDTMAAAGSGNRALGT